VTASANSASIGTHPSYAGYTGFWKHGYDYSVLTEGSHTYVNAPHKDGWVYFRSGNNYPGNAWVNNGGLGLAPGKGLWMDCKKIHAQIRWDQPGNGGINTIYRKDVNLSCGAGFTPVSTRCTHQGYILHLVGAGDGLCQFNNPNGDKYQTSTYAHNTTNCCRINTNDGGIYEYNLATGNYTLGAPTSGLQLTSDPWAVPAQ
jgi:hypothetical protein